MDNLREYKTNTKTAKSAEVISDIYELLTGIIEFIGYLIGNTIFSIREACKTEAAKKAISTLQKHLSVWCATLGVFLLLGIVGGMESGLISFAVGVGACLILFICAAFAFKKKKH